MLPLADAGPGGPGAVDLSNPQSRNAYEYVLNNPTTLTDPSGLHGECSSEVSNGNGGCEGAAIPGALDKETQTGTVLTNKHHSSNPVNSAQQLRYKKGVPPASPAVGRMLGCTQSCAGFQLTVTSTTDIVTVNGRAVAHRANTPHGRGEAADVRANRKTASQILACGAVCGARFGVNEVAHPSAHATGPHVHLQITPGRNGGRGDLPSPQEVKEFLESIGGLTPPSD